jgi:hypothetical protein
LRPQTRHSRAIQNGATTLAEGFLFFVAASLIVGESYRGRQSTAKRRDDVDDALEGLRKEVEVLKSLVEGLDDKVAKMGASRLENGSEREGGGDAGPAGNGSSLSPTKVTTASEGALEKSSLQVGGPAGSGERYVSESMAVTSSRHFLDLNTLSHILIDILSYFFIDARSAFLN